MKQIIQDEVHSLSKDMSDKIVWTLGLRNVYEKQIFSIGMPFSSRVIGPTHILSESGRALNAMPAIQICVHPWMYEKTHFQLERKYFFFEKVSGKMRSQMNCHFHGTLLRRNKTQWILYELYKEFVDRGGLKNVITRIEKDVINYDQNISNDFDIKLKIK